MSKPLAVIATSALCLVAALSCSSIAVAGSSAKIDMFAQTEAMRPAACAYDAPEFIADSAFRRTVGKAGIVASGC